jgi:hypothetical protein
VPKILSKSCELIVDMVFADNEIASAFAKAGSAKVLVAAMKKHPCHKKIQRYSCMALNNLACGTNRSFSKKVYMADGIHALFKAMELHPADPFIQLYSLDCLDSICRYCPASGIDLLERGSIESTIGTMEIHLKNAKIQKAACSFLTTLIDTGEKRVHEKKESWARVVETVLETMKAHSDDPCIQQCSCDCLSSIYQEKLVNENKEAWTRVVETVFQTMKAHSADPCIQLYSLDCLDSICRYYATSASELLKMGSIESTLTAMKAHTNDPEIQTAACTFLTSLINKSKGGKRFYERKRGRPLVVETVQILCKTMKAHSDNIVLLCCCRCLDSIEALQLPYQQDLVGCTACLANS